METLSVQRFCAVALAVGAVLIAAYSIAFAALFPRDALLLDLGAAVVTPAWRTLALTALVAVLLLMIGFGGVYSRMARTGGVLGLAGFLTLELAYFFQAAKVTWELCIYPLLARDPGAAGLLTSPAFHRDPGVAAFRLVATLAILVGVVLFSLAIVRSRVLPWVAGVLVLVGAVMYGVGPMVSIAFAYVGIVVLAAGCLMLARALLRPAPAAGTAAAGRAP
jgi:hypothetical protein